MYLYGRYRYRNKVRLQIELILQRLNYITSRMILHAAFGYRWRRALNALAEADTDPPAAAATATIFAIEKIIREMSPDRREITLFAIKAGNSSNNEANNFIAMIDGIWAVHPNEVMRKHAIYTVIGALEGRFGDDLQNYRIDRLVYDATQS